MTRFEKIKNMNIDEFVEWLGNFRWNICGVCSHKEACSGGDCEDGITQYLNSAETK